MLEAYFENGGIAERSGAFIWHVYDDLGQYEINASQPDPASIRVAISSQSSS